jgi:thiol-disulfide isomerase/thioredoxin
MRAALALLALATAGPDASHWLVGAPAPALPLTTLSGEPAAAPWAERPGVVVLWAGWCGPCVAELPELAAALNDVPDAVSVTLISTDDDRAAARRALGRAVRGDPGWTSLWGGPSAAGLFASRTLPTAYRIDATGHIRTVWTGKQDAAAWRQIVSPGPPPDPPPAAPTPPAELPASPR